MTETFLEKLDKVIAKHSMLDSKFYQAWNKGELPLSAIKEYAKQRYAFEVAFPTYVSAVHARCGNNFNARRMLLENLMDEELWPVHRIGVLTLSLSSRHNMPWHQELWLQFTSGLGIPAKKVFSAELFPETLSLLETFKTLTRNEDYRVGLAALYAYESQEPLVSKTKRVGLENHYEIRDHRALETFSVHESADIEHSYREKVALEASCLTPKHQTDAIYSAETASAAWRLFLGSDIFCNMLIVSNQKAQEVQA